MAKRRSTKKRSASTFTLINRSIIVVRPKQPFADWANSFDDGSPKFDLEEQRREAPNSYLVYDYTESDNLRFIIDFYWATVFEYELNAWMRDPKTWPQTRTLEMFRQWFDIDFAPVVSDIVADVPLEI